MQAANDDDRYVSCVDRVGLMRVSLPSESNVD